MGSNNLMSVEEVAGIFMDVPDDDRMSEVGEFSGSEGDLESDDDSDNDSDALSMQGGGVDDWESPNPSDRPDEHRDEDVLQTTTNYLSENVCF